MLAVYMRFVGARGRSRFRLRYPRAFVFPFVGARGGFARPDLRLEVADSLVAFADLSLQTRHALLEAVAVLFILGLFFRVFRQDASGFCVRDCLVPVKKFLVMLVPALGRELFVLADVRGNIAQPIRGLRR